MTKLIEGPISSQSLMQRLASAKKVMNKVESGNFSRGHIDESALISDDIDIPQNMLIPEGMIEQQYEERVNTRPVGVPSIEKIQQSRLPDAIKKAMIDNPINQTSLGSISLGETLDMNFVNGVKRLMEEEGTISKVPKQTQHQPQRQQQYNNTPAPSYIGNDNLLVALTPIIENIIRKTLDDIVDKKLSQILTAQQTASINENLVLKVGDSIFRGKITGVNKASKK